jgi:hypothetical protein
MSRSSTALDRTATLIVGLLLIAVGAGTIIWNTTWLPRIPESITAPGLALSARSWWWPWAVTAAGIAAVLLGLRWLASHALARRAHTVALTGSGENGTLTTDLAAIATAAAHRLELDPGVHSAKATAIIDRGRRTLDITATAASVNDIPATAAAADQVCCEAITMLGDDTVATRTRIRVDTKRHRGRRRD